MVSSQKNGVSCMTPEHKIQDEIRIALSPYCLIFRINVGKLRTPDGRFITTGVPKGFSDLFGFRKSDGKAIFIEVKTLKGKPTQEQMHFLDTMQKNGAIAGICRSVQDAINLIKEEI